jgi:hypothetical protein
VFVCLAIYCAFYVAALLLLSLLCLTSIIDIYVLRASHRTRAQLRLFWAYLTKKAPHTAATPIATAFRTCICISQRKNGPLNRLPGEVSFSIFD